MMYFFYDIVWDFKAKLLIPSYHTTAGLLLFLLALAGWKYWNVMRRYSKFPSYSVLAYYINDLLLGKLPNNVPFTCVVFQKLVSVLKEFQNEGVCIVWLGRPYLYIFSEEAFKIFSNEKEAVDKLHSYDIAREVLGSGLVTSNGETWRKHRKLMNPVFHVGVLKQKLPLFNEYGKILVEKLSKSGRDPSVDILEHLKYCSINILVESIFGFKMNNKVNDDMVKQFTEKIDKVAEMSMYIVCNPWLHYKFMWSIIPYAKKFRKTVKECDDLIEKIISNLKKSSQTEECNGENSENEDGLRTKAFARILMEISKNDPAFTAYDLKSHVITFLIAGYDTIAHTLLYCLFLLGLHPDVQEQAFIEINSFAGDYINFGNLQELRYLECVIKETLRIYTIIPCHGRCTNKDIQCGKYLVPKGTDVMFCPYMLHRDPKLYSNPEKFKPERFLQENSDQRPWIHTPFSEGVRSCIGKKFAMMEMMVILAHVIRNFRITSLDKREDVDLCWNFALMPLKPLNIKFTSRQQ